MKYAFPKGSTSVIVPVFIQDSSSTTGAGLGSLDQTSSIVGGYLRPGSTGVALAVDENVTTEGTYQAPSAAGKVRIGTPANMRTGTYELHLHNDLLASGADAVFITLGGASNMADLVIEIQLTDVNLNDGVRGGMTALPNAAADANNGLVTGDGSVTLTAGVGNRPSVDATALGGTVQSATDLKDFADDGYDPATNKVQGLLLCDTTTENTDMVGTDSAALASVCTEARLEELDGLNLPFDVAAVKADTTAILVDTGTTLDAKIDTILADTGEIGTAGAGLTDLGGMSTGMKGEVNTEVADVIDTDTSGEPAQGAPAATASLRKKLDWLYKVFRNKKTQTATDWKLYDDAGTTVDSKATVSADGTTATKEEVVTGP
ncbi:hypothetical protein LCGC14_2630050 [marine sediment metagenome]|uniref:Uncharacterized protein n=1 Tax=marine sediment metagenome TaxID=412755 RepID=A0A0F9AN52_9ZZZZ